MSDSAIAEQPAIVREHALPFVPADAARPSTRGEVGRTVYA